MIKKKRKIKVRAALNGLIASNSEMAGINGYLTKNYPIPSISLQSIEGVSTAPEVPSTSNIVGLIGGVARGIGNLVSIGSAAANLLIGAGQAAIGGLGAGATAGAAFGPIGAGIGAAVGAVTGVLSSGLSGGRDAQMTSFTDYDEGELAGFLRPGKRRRLRRLREKMKVNAYNNRAAVAGTERLLNEWAEDFGDMDTNTFAYGGLTNALAYVDDGELIQTPDGTVSKVPEQGKPTDSNLVSLPEGSKILSDSLKVPGTNKTFAQVGEEMMAIKKSKFNDIYAENAAKLNEMNNKTIHDLLFEMLEAVKAKKGIKRKYKNAVIAANDGDEVTPWSWGDKFKYLIDGKYDLGYLDFVNNLLTQDMIDRALSERPELFARFRSKNPNYSPTLQEGRKWATDYKPSDWHKAMEYIYDNRQRLGSPSNRFIMRPSDWINPANDTPVEGELNILRSIPLQPKRITKTDNGNDNNNKSSFDPAWLDTISSLGSTIGGLMPIIANLREDPEYQRPVYNPFMGEALRTMRRRRYDINPAVRDMERNRAITNYNAGQMNTNTGANLAFRLLNAVNTNRAIADLRSTENNVNNAYLGEYAQMAANLGEQWAAESRRVDEANIASRAQARNIRRAGLSGVSQYLQNNEFMRNQRNRDNMMMALYDPFLEAGFTTLDLTNFRNWLRRTNK